MSDEAVEAVAEALQAALSHERDERTGGEARLVELSAHAGFCQALLTVASTDDAPRALRQVAATTFKNHVRVQWPKGDEAEYVIGADDRHDVKAHIVRLMLSATDSVVRKQLSTAVAAISEADFPERWDNLLPELVAQLDTDDLAQLNGVLATLHAVLRKFRVFVDEAVCAAQLRYVLDELAAPLCALCESTAAALAEHADNEAAVVPLLRAALYVTKIFYSLCYPTVPAEFETASDAWFGALRALLTYDTPHAAALEHDNDAKPGLLYKVKASVCACCDLWMEKYEEEFDDYVETFVHDACALVVALTDEERHDRLVIAALGFLRTVAAGPRYDVLQADDTLSNLCVHIVLPNMAFRDADAELFEENTTEYIRRDIEGSDSDTRRRAAIDLVKGLRVHFTEAVTAIFSTHINELLDAHARDGDWKAKDTALQLITALTVTTFTRRDGAR
eukprot:CAMPEP_0198311372 /NCGR_PEP_ID=MMETSP1450-20131203/3112_1 /TAXON_ID=753684 ORGANISM="Madagascaria erythrocladiodes, Strain CCMP3234" /NCGR_SAMPLE_ID=MMETSP1450 /ASSEMBLY_ACC=CAM_ASM_001115 /LENGTH=449 /DNA_ID=CAMNT_0044014243 /DNA_START=23 /DNA_END=1369 /DNA_ORIENTATION=-